MAEQKSNIAMAAVILLLSMAGTWKKENWKNSSTPLRISDDCTP